MQRIRRSPSPSLGEVTPVQGVIHVTPEPTALGLLAIGAVALLRRVRHDRTDG